MMDMTNKKDYENFAIVADIGGTTTTVAIMGVKDHDAYEIILSQRHDTKEITSLDRQLNSIMKEAKDTYDIEVSTGCFCVAGPLSNGRKTIKLTNTYLEINADSILRKTMLSKIVLLNDFEAIGYGIDSLDPKKDIVSIHQPNHSSHDRPRAILGAGTGLGMGIIVYDNNLPKPIPSEGGHMDFAAYDELEWELASYLRTHVSRGLPPDMERVLSGQGLENVFDFLSSRFYQTETIRRIRKIKGAQKLDEIRVHYGKDSCCTKSVDLFIKFYARAAKNLALFTECYSGLYIFGRIANRYSDRFTDKEFLAEFCRHDKKSELLANIPIYLILNTDVSLYGCCNVAAKYPDLN
jgi:glucokinase